jgi:hypothetical protein
MPKSFVCRDDGEFPYCPVVVPGDTAEEARGRVVDHGR